MKKILILTLILCILMCGCDNDDKLVGAIGAKTGYEKAVENLIDVAFYYNLTENNLLKTAPRNFWELWADEEEMNIDDLFSKMESQGSYEKKYIPESLSVDYEIKYLTKLSEEECSRIESALEEEYEVNFGEITKGYSFYLILKYTEENDAYDIDVGNVVSVKMDGEWYIAEYSDDSIGWLVDSFI